LQGGIYLLMYTSLAFIVLPFLVSRPWHAIRATLLAGVWALGLASFKLVPVLYWLRQFPDDAYASSAYSLPWLGEILFGRHLHGTYLIFEQMTGWHEYGAYVGYIALGLAIIGLVSFWRNRLAKALLIATLLAGGLSTIGPYLIPIFDELWFFPRSSVSRFIFFAVIPLSLFAGLGLQRIQTQGKRLSFLSWLLVGALAIDLFSLTYQLSEQAFILPPVLNPPEEIAAPIVFTPDSYSAPLQGDRYTRSFAAAQAGYGTLTYCSVLGPTPRVRTIYDEGANGPVFVAAPQATWEITKWTPNEVAVNVATPETTEVALNTNFVNGWHVSTGRLTQLDGRLASEVPAGQHQLTFAYRAPGFRLGAALSAFTLLTALYLGRRSSRKTSKVLNR